MLTNTMDSALIFLLIVLVAFAAALYYLYVTGTWHDWGYRARTSIIILMGVLAPVLVMTLLHQHDAKNELAAYGVSIQPELGSSVGVSTGSFADGTHWVFSFDGGRPALLDYYREPKHRPGWAITEDNNVFLILKKGDQHLTISASDDAAIFQLSRKSSQP